MNSKSRAAFFENLRKTGSINPMVPKVKSPKIKQEPIIDPTKSPDNMNINNPNALATPPGQTRFKKMKRMFGI